MPYQSMSFSSQLVQKMLEQEHTKVNMIDQQELRDVTDNNTIKLSSKSKEGAGGGGGCCYASRSAVINDI